MGLWILRGTFLFVAAGIGFSVGSSNTPFVDRGWIVPTVVGGAIFLVFVDVLLPRKRIEVISTVYLGIVVALFLTYVISTVLETVMFGAEIEGQQYRGTIRVILTTALSYICISLLVQTKDEFRFIIPYVEFSKEIKGQKPFILDTSVIIDGRISDILETNIIDNQLIIPRFVLSELQNIADSNDKLRRARGRRGLDIITRLRNNESIELQIHEPETVEMQSQPVDMKLVLLARDLHGKVVTGDYNLNKVATIHNVPVINLNEVSNALKPVFLPGERFSVQIVKAGEEANQGVGYLDDGTMIVVEEGERHINNKVPILVTSVLQTSAGRMIFGRCEAA
ncbi:MAG: PIN domain-containing protein [Pirellulales bacterium]|nr:PIN domain-containing protein [Pirellulales bacterium]